MSSSANPGIGVDAAGNPVVDPTQNVLDLVEAAIKRQDDLRAAAAEHTKEMASLRARYDERLREAESDRIDAIRAVDVGNVAAAAAAAETRATTLAGQVATSAEALRNQVSEAATAQTVALAAALDPIQKDIADLRRAQYEAQGQKTQVVETQAHGSGVALWVSIGVAAVAFVFSAIVGLVSVLVALHSAGVL